MKILDINGARYACHIHQRDTNLPWLLMVHGFMGDHRVFNHLKDELCQSCNPVAVDLLGHGHSSKPTDPNRYHEQQQMDDIVQLIQRLNLSPLFLYGYSMGGRLALKTALKNPKLFHGLILESTTNGIADEEKRKERRKIDKSRARQIEDDYEEFLSRWEEAALFQSFQPVDQHLKKKYDQIHREQNPNTMAASLRGFGTGFMTPETDPITEFNKPVLLIAGSGDEKYVQIYKQELSPLFSNVHVCFIKAGHRVHLDNPTQLVQEIKNHIDLNSLL